MARPCHGMWIEPTIHHALETVPVILYVGLKKNFAQDLESIEGIKITKKFFKAGKDGEVVYEIRKL